MGISQNEFESIIQKVAEETPCCDGVEINGSKVRMHWTSNRGHHYTERYDFNDHGEITGNYLYIESAPPYPGSTVPGIFENRSCSAIRRFIRENTV